MALSSHRTTCCGWRYQKPSNSKLPSLTHITGLNTLCTGHLKDVRDKQCPARYPHILGHIHSHHIDVRVRREKSEGDVRENECPSHAFSPLQIGLWEGSCEYVRDIFDSMIFRVQVIGKSQSSMVRVSSVRKALPLPSRAPSARSGRGVRFLRTMPLLPSRY